MTSMSMRLWVGLFALVVFIGGGGRRGGPQPLDPVE